MNPTNIPFTQRFGVGLPPGPLGEEVPDSARTGLIIFVADLCETQLYLSWDLAAAEALRAARRLTWESDSGNPRDTYIGILRALQWHHVYLLFERIYRRLHGSPIWDEYGNRTDWGPVEEAQQYYTEEINQLLAEEGLDYQFVDGAFERRGRPQTQKNLQRVGAVLSEARFAPVRNHYNKALSFFNERPDPDVENCVKEAVCALEAFLEVIFVGEAAKDFDKILRSKQGNSKDQIPPALVDGMIKLRAFRGNAQGVAHAALQGGQVTVVEAELVLSLTACYVTYLNDKFPNRWDSIPF